MQNNVSRGRGLEYAVRDHLQDRGYIVFRCAGSRPLDLIAVKEGQILLVECKTGRNPCLPPEQLNHILEIAKKAGGTLILVIRKRHGKIKWFKVTDQGMKRWEKLYWLNGNGRLHVCKTSRSRGSCFGMQKVL